MHSYRSNEYVVFAFKHASYLPEKMMKLVRGGFCCFDPHWRFQINHDKSSGQQVAKRLVSSHLARPVHAATQSFDRMHGYLAPQHKPPRSTNIKPKAWLQIDYNSIQQPKIAPKIIKISKDLRRSEKIREAGIVGNDIGLHPHAAHLPQQLQDFGPSSQAAQLGDDFGVLPKR